MATLSQPPQSLQKEERIRKTEEKRGKQRSGRNTSQQHFPLPITAYLPIHLPTLPGYSSSASTHAINERIRERNENEERKNKKAAEIHHNLTVSLPIATYLPTLPTYLPSLASFLITPPERTGGKIIIISTHIKEGHQNEREKDR